MTPEQIHNLLRSDAGFLRLRGAVAHRPGEIIEILRDSKLWFSSVLEQDDIFEGRPRLAWREQVNLNDLYALAQNQMAGAHDDERRDVARQMFERLMNPVVVADVRAKIGDHLLEMYQNSSICCFFKDFQRQRSWAEYAQRGRGFGLVFDFSTPWRYEPWAHMGEVEMVPFPVRYQAGERPQVEMALAPAEPTRAFEDIEKALLTKSIDWQEQNEFRLIRVGAGSGYVDFPEESLVAIILGYAIEAADEVALRRAAHTHRPDLPLYRVVPSVAGFSLDLNAA